MRAVKIDPLAQKSSTIELTLNPNESLQEIYEIIGSSKIKTARFGRGNLLIAAEEEGEQTPEAAFHLPLVGIIYGTALVLKETDEGEIVDAKFPEALAEISTVYLGPSAIAKAKNFSMEFVTGPIRVKAMSNLLNIIDC